MLSCLYSPLLLTITDTELDQSLLELDTVLLSSGVTRLTLGPHLPGHLVPGVEPPEHSLGLQVTGSYPEARGVGPPGQQILLQLGQLLSVCQLYQMTWTIMQRVKIFVKYSSALLPSLFMQSYCAWDHERDLVLT